jgi:hypothetical protein
MELKIKNKEELKGIAVDVFKNYPKAQKVAVTSDGEAFITDEGDNAVKNHSKKNRYGKELEIVPFTRDNINAEGKGTTAKEVIASIKEAATLEAVQALLAAENALETPRKSVVDAANARIKELQPA